MPLVNFATADMTPGTVTILGEDVPSGVASADGAFVRRVGGDPTRYARDGQLLASATFETAQVPMSALTEVFGLETTARWPGGASATDAVAIQVSVDGGESFLAWTGAAWEAQDADGTFNDLPTFNDHCHELPLANPRSLSFRVKLTPANDRSPLLLGLHAYVEWRYDPRMALFEMLRDRLVLLRVPLDVIHRMQSAGASLPLRPGYVVDPDGAFCAHDLTADPLMNTNLFSGWDADTSTLSLASSVAAGHDVLVRCQGSAPVVLVKQDETLKKTQLPVTTVYVGRVTPAAYRSVGQQREWKRGDALRRVRERQWPALVEVAVVVHHHSSDEAATIYSVEALRRVMSGEPLRLPATGERPDVVEVDAGQLSDPTGESAYGATWSCRLRLHLHEQDFREAEAVREVGLGVGSPRMRWERDSHSRT